MENAAAGQQLNMGSTPIFDQNRGYWPLDPSSFNESESALNFSETMAETPLCHSVLSRKANSGLLQAEDANILVETPQGSKEKLGQEGGQCHLHCFTGIERRNLYLLSALQPHPPAAPEVPQTPAHCLLESFIPLLFFSSFEEV